MHIGIAFDLKPDAPLASNVPDDMYEEFDSPDTIQAIANVLQGMGHHVSLRGNGRTFVESLLRDPPDLIFNFAEGTGVSRNRESRVPAICEMLDIACTGSDPLALGLALDKAMTRRVAESAGIVIPKGVVLSFDKEPYDGDFSEFPAILDANELTLPVIAKPTCEGSSKGVRNRSLISSVAEFGPTVMQLWQDYHQPVLVEEFIDGMEVTVGLIGNDPPQVMGSMEILPKVPDGPFIYSLEVKRNYQEKVNYRVPQLPVSVIREIEAAAWNAFITLGCRDVARADFRVRDGIPYFLEINPLPGLNPTTGDIVILSGIHQVSYEQLIARIVTAATDRCFPRTMQS